MIRKTDKIMTLLGLFFALVSLIRFSVLGEPEAIALSALTILLVCIPYILEKYLQRYLSLPIVILSILYALTPLLGRAYRLYYLISWWDKLMHAAAGFLFAYLGLDLGKRLSKGRGTHTLYLVFGLCFSISIACIWEFFEFSCDRVLETDMQQDRIVTEIHSHLLSSKQGAVSSIYEIDDVSINGISFDGYIDVGLIDTMGDMIAETLGAVLFVIFYGALKGKHFETQGVCSHEP